MKKFDMRATAGELRRVSKLLRSAAKLVDGLQTRIKKEGRLEWARWHKWHDAHQQGKALDFSDPTVRRSSAYAGRLSDAEEVLNGFAMEVEIAARNATNAAGILSVRPPGRPRRRGR